MILTLGCFIETISKWVEIRSSRWCLEMLVENKSDWKKNLWQCFAQNSMWASFSFTVHIVLIVGHGVNQEIVLKESLLKSDPKIEVFGKILFWFIRW